MKVAKVNLNHDISDVAKRKVNREVNSMIYFVKNDKMNVAEISDMMKDAVNNYYRSVSNCTLKGMKSEAMLRAEIAHGLDAIYEAWLSSESVNTGYKVDVDILHRLKF